MGELEFVDKFMLPGTDALIFGGNKEGEGLKISKEGRNANYELWDRSGCGNVSREHSLFLTKFIIDISLY